MGAGAGTSPFIEAARSPSIVSECAAADAALDESSRVKMKIDGGLNHASEIFRYFFIYM
jgi:hypothetical protein